MAVGNVTIKFNDVVKNNDVARKKYLKRRRNKHTTKKRCLDIISTDTFYAIIETNCATKFATFEHLRFRKYFPKNSLFIPAQQFVAPGVLAYPYIIRNVKQQ